MSPQTSTLPSSLISNFRGATVEDLDLPPALSITPQTPISTALSLSYDRDYSQLTVIHPLTKSLLGYVSSARLQSHRPSASASARPDEDPEPPVSEVMTRFDRRRSKGYRLITPETPLEELHEFFEGGEDFAVVTDPERRFVLAVATREDLKKFLERRPAL